MLTVGPQRPQPAGITMPSKTKGPPGWAIPPLARGFNHSNKLRSGRIPA